MPNNPCPLPFGLASLEFLDEVLENAGLIWIREVEVVENIVDIPKIRVDGNDAKTLSSSMCVSTVMERCLMSFGCGDPTVPLPEAAKEFIIPTEDIVLSSCVWADVIRRVVCLGKRVMIAQRWIDGHVTHLGFEDCVGYVLFIFDISSAQLVIVLRDYVSDLVYEYL